MIVIDTSALMAILLAEPEAEACIGAIEDASAALISAGTLTECLVVAGRRDVEPEMSALIRGAGLQVAPLTEHGARLAAEAYARWGKGVHPAGLNLGDCFAYALAREHECALLFVGEDFARTDVRAALPRVLRDPS